MSEEPKSIDDIVFGYLSRIYPDKAPFLKIEEEVKKTHKDLYRKGFVENMVSYVRAGDLIGTIMAFDVVETDFGLSQRKAEELGVYQEH